MTLLHPEAKSFQPFKHHHFPTGFRFPGDTGTIFFVGSDSAAFEAMPFMSVSLLADSLAC